MSTPESIRWDAEMVDREFLYGHYCYYCDRLMDEVDGLKDNNYYCAHCDTIEAWDD